MGTVFDAFFRILKISAASFTKSIKRAVTEQAVEVFRISTRMTGKKFTFPIAEEFIVFHNSAAGFQPSEAAVFLPSLFDIIQFFQNTSGNFRITFQNLLQYCVPFDVQMSVMHFKPNDTERIDHRKIVTGKDL